MNLSELNKNFFTKKYKIYRDKMPIQTFTNIVTNTQMGKLLDSSIRGK